MLFLAAGSAFSAPTPEQLITKSKQLKLSEQRVWRKLLFYDYTGFGNLESYFDSPEYFLAKNGKHNPQAELEATLKAFFHPVSKYKEEREHPQCLYPARLKILSRELGFAKEDLPKVECKALDTWMSRRDYVSMSIVFSSYYSGNPASLFGHTFFRMHREHSDHALTDDAVNFLAYPWSDNAIIYASAGVTGLFPGKFDLIPYFMKLQEYNNLESRDLWEYKLKLNVDEIETLILIVWEAGPHHIDYWYFDDNCSAILLRLIEAAKPETVLPFNHPWIIPMDTLQTAVRGSYGDAEPQFEFQPSSRNRFSSLYGRLSDEEQDLIGEMIETENIEPLVKDLETVRQARVLDTFVELIDYKEKLAASNPAKEHKQRRFDALRIRSKNKTKPLKTGFMNPLERPDLAQPSSRIGPFVGYTNEQDLIYQFEWRPALTGIASSDIGFSSGLAIDFFKTKFRLYPEEGYRLGIQEYSLLKIESYADIEWIIRPVSWHLGLRYLNVPTCAGDDIDTDDCGMTVVRSGIGYVFPFFNKFITIGAMADGGFGTSTEVPGHAFAEVGGTGIMTLKFSPNFKVHYLHHQRAQYYDNGVEKTFPEGQADIAFTPKRLHEIRGSFYYNRKYADGLIGYFYHW